MFNHKLPSDFPMQTLRKKTSPCKYKNEPGRFLGEGVSYRAKLIGVLEVPEARGDTMCQEALADLKMAIRAAGEHKQRIQIHVAIDGLRLRDDKTGDCLYHHPVHKISFIAQDMTDSRAFGYIFGSPDSGHRFFGIKTDKAASQVVIAMRDLFQVVFELKKKEVEIKKQQVEGKSTTSSLVRHTISTGEVRELKYKSAPSQSVGVGESPSVLKDSAEGGVADLVDLEQELCSLRRGLIQVEGLTPSTDPFGDSFTAAPQPKGLIPPPPSGSSSRGRNTPATTATPTATTTTNTRSVFSPNKTTLPFDLPSSEFEPSSTTLVDNLTETPVSAATSSTHDVFTELDPLGTGRSKPYVDKKLFFQELKNPPKKVLKDIVTKDIDKDFSQTMTSLTRQSGGSVTVSKPFTFSDPFAEADPFDNSDPFESFKEDPFTSMQGLCLKGKLSREGTVERSGPMEPVRSAKNMFNGPLQVSLPPEPTPKSPRLNRQNTDTGTIRQRPQPITKLSIDNASPPPPLPPKKIEINIAKPPPRPPHEYEETEIAEPGPPLPRPARKKEPMADRTTKPPCPQLSSVATNSSEDEYLCPAPPPLPNAKRFDITLSQLLVCTMPELSARLRVPASTLSSMTLPQLTEYLRSYLAADNERAHIHVDPTEKENPPPAMLTKSVPEKNAPIPSAPSAPPSTDFTPQFEDNFTPPETSEFVANFDDFEQKASSSYDRYAAFREIQEQELKSKSILDPVETKSDSEAKQYSDSKEEMTSINELVTTNGTEPIETSRSPLKSLDELTLDSFNMFRNSVSPKPTQIDAKIEDIKSVMKNLQIETSRRSLSPRENNLEKQDDSNDRYAALREITIIEPQDEFESLPPEVSLPKERKRSDEKSDGFDNSDFFDCIDNSSLSFSHVDDAFRKSPSVKEKEVEKKEEVATIEPIRDLQPPARMSTGSISDVASASSPDTKDARALPTTGKHWSMLQREASPPSAGSPPSASPSSDSDLRPAKPTRGPRAQRRDSVQTSSSSRDVSPWEEEPPPIPRLQRPPPSLRDRESRHNSSGSRECLDSGSGRDKDKKRDKRERERDRDISRDSRESRIDSGSGRDRRDSKEREHRDHREPRDRRDRRSRDREKDTWERDRSYRDRDYRDTRSRDRDRNKEYMARDKDRDRHRKRRVYDDEEDYSDGRAAGGRWAERWRRDDRNYGSLGWRESRRRNDIRQSDDPADRRYGTTLAWPGRRSSSRRDSERDRDVLIRDRDIPPRDRDILPRDRDIIPRDRDIIPRDRDIIPRDRDISARDVIREREVSREVRESGRDQREPRRRSRRDQTRKSRDYRFSNDFSPRERDATSPFENEFLETPSSGKKRTNYSTLEGTRFAFEAEDTTASPLSTGSTRARDGDSPATRFRFDSDSISPRSMFEDDFTTISTPRCRTASIAEEDEDVPPLRAKPQTHRDIKKSESVNIFTKEVDPFEGDDFFACTGSDRVARRENWPGDFQGFDNA